MQTINLTIDTLEITNKQYLRQAVGDGGVVRLVGDVEIFAGGERIPQFNEYALRGLGVPVALQVDWYYATYPGDTEMQQDLDNAMADKIVSTGWLGYQQTVVIPDSVQVARETVMYEEG